MSIRSTQQHLPRKSKPRRVARDFVVRCRASAVPGTSLLTIALTSGAGQTTYRVSAATARALHGRLGSLLDKAAAAAAKAAVPDGDNQRLKSRGAESPADCEPRH